MRIFDPAIYLLNKLRFSLKFLIIMTVTGIAGGVLIFALFKQLNTQIEFNAFETLGVEYLEPIQLVFEDAVAYGDVLQHGDEALEQQIEEHFEKVQEVDARLGPILNMPNSSISVQIDEIQQLWQQVKSSKSEQDYEKWMASIVHIYQHEIANNSNLILDPDLDTYYLMNSYLFLIPNFTSILNELYMTLQQYDGKTLTMAEKTEVIRLYEGLSSAVSGLESNFDTQTQHTVDPSLFNDMQQILQLITKSSEELLATVEQQFILQEGVVDGTVVATLNTPLQSLFKHIHAYHYEHAAALDQLIDVRISDYKQIKYLSMAAIFIFGAIAFYFIIGFYISIRHAVQHLQKVAQRVETGELHAQADIAAKDEFAEVAQSFNHIIRSFRSIIQFNRQTIEHLSTNSQHMLAHANHTRDVTNLVTNNIEDFSKGMQQQLLASHESANTVTEIVQHIGDIENATVLVANASQENSQMSQQGNDLLQQMSGQIASIQQTFERAATTIQLLAQRSHQIHDITATMEGISNQTNLLALNASIEAARAGEHGKGFAVVAREVRKLAEQSNESAVQISNLIHEVLQDTGSAVKAMEVGTQEVERGMQVVQQAGQAFEEILSSAQNVSTQATNISQAAKQLSGASTMITQKVSEVQHITVQSSEQTEQLFDYAKQQLLSMENITNASIQLDEIAKQLAQGVRKFEV